MKSDPWSFGESQTDDNLGDYMPHEDQTGYYDDRRYYDDGGYDVEDPNRPTTSEMDDNFRDYMPPEDQMGYYDHRGYYDDGGYDVEDPNRPTTSDSVTDRIFSNPSAIGPTEEVTKGIQCWWEIEKGQICGCFFHTPADVVNHIWMDHTRRDVNFVCFWSGCVRELRPMERGSALVHLRRHTAHKCLTCNKNVFDSWASGSNVSGGPFDCSKCEKEKEGEMQKEDLITLMNSIAAETKLPHKSPQSQFKCSVCLMKFNTKEDLSDHIACHTGKNQYPCKVPGCSRIFEYPSTVAMHVDEFHSEDSATDEIIQCGWVTNGKSCGLLCLSATDLEEHIQLEHINDTKEMACGWQKCEDAALYEDGVLPFQTNLASKVNYEYSQSAEQYVPDICSEPIDVEKSFDSRTAEPYPYNIRKQVFSSCPVTTQFNYPVAETFLKNDPLERYILPTMSLPVPVMDLDLPVDSNSSPGFCCLWIKDGRCCMKTCSDPTDLAEHIRTYHAEESNNFVCSWKGCELELEPIQLKCNAVVHLRTHTGETSYDCKSCYAKYMSVEPDQCLECGKTWLKGRQVTQKRERDPMAHQCLWVTDGGVCERKFQRPSCLKRHVIGFHIKKSETFFCSWEGCELNWKPFQRDDHNTIYIEGMYYTADSNQVITLNQFIKDILVIR